MAATNYICRDIYLRKLIDRRDNGEIKIVTGPRRSGKSWLLKKEFACESEQDTQQSPQCSTFEH